MNNKFAEQDYLTVGDIQRWLNISQGAAYGLVHRKDFPVSHFGSIVRIPREPFLAWVEDNTNNPRNYGAGHA